MRCLVAIDGLRSRGFPSELPGQPGWFAVRHGQTVRVFVNACPHLGLPLEWQPDRFLSADGEYIVCATHGAEFRVADGVCVRGPCRGERLTPVPCEVAGGMVLVPPERPD